MDDLATIAEWIGIGPHRVLEDAPRAAVAIRGDGKIAYANRATVTLFGYSRPELIGLSIEALLPEGRRNKHASYINGWFAHPRPRPMGAEHLDIEGRNKNGELMKLDIQLAPIETDKGIMALAWVEERNNA